MVTMFLNKSFSTEMSGAMGAFKYPTNSILELMGTYSLLGKHLVKTCFLLCDG